MFDIDVKKGQMRQFLGFCVELANLSEDRERREQKLDRMLKEKVFAVTFHQKDLDEEHKCDVLMSETIHLHCNLQNLATLIASGEHFSVTFEERRRTYRFTKDSNNQRPVLDLNRLYVRYEDTVEYSERCWQATWFEIFFSNLLQYARSRKELILDVPLGVCLECENIFLGRRKGQKFCSKEHGQRWRAREAYRNKAKG